MKFGGTSVEDAAAMRRTAAIVRGRRERGLQPVVVVSAMAKVTDQLLNAAACAGRGCKADALAISSRLRHRHIETANDLLCGELFTEVEASIHRRFDSLDDLLRGIAAVGELTPRTSDKVVSYGERLSSRIVAAAFAQEGLNGAHVDARRCILTDSNYGKAVPQEAGIERALAVEVLPLVEAGKTPVMGGFIGADALRVKAISFEEAAELAYFGAKVLHPATILPAVQKSIPVWVLNSRNAANEGTRITAVAPPCASPFKSIAVKKRLTIIDIVANRMLMSHGYLKAVFDIFDRYHCIIDMVSTSEVSVSVTVDSNQRLPEICAELEKIADVKLEGSKALICMVGEDIRGQSGISGRVFSAIRHVNVRMISQGASEINMSFMIEEADVEEAVRALHHEFFSAPDATVFDIEARSV